MKINAIIESKDGGTLVLDFPRSIYDVYEKLQSVGIRQSPHQITLSDEEGDDVRVKLYSEDEIGKHLLLTLKEHNSLADANMLAFMVDNAKPDFRSKLEQNLLNDQYSSMQEVTDDIKQMLYESGPVKAVFYCPLVGEVTDEEGFSSPVDGRFLKSYAWAVEEALEADTADDEMDMAEFFDEDDSVKAKLVSAKWGVETYRGRLFGRIECSLKEELTDAETEILTDWISGQNSDGYGEHFEQQPIDTEDGDLYVSFWNSGDNYSIMTRDELDEYIDNQGMTMGGILSARGGHLFEPVTVKAPEAKELKTQAMTDEKLEVVEVLGQTALYTNGRVTQKELPDGLYKYDLREGESIAFATVEPSVAVNHAGTIITKEPIIFGEEGYIELDDDSSPNFLGDHMSVEEFQNTDFSQDEDESLTMGGMRL